MVDTAPEQDRTILKAWDMLNPELVAEDVSGMPTTFEQMVEARGAAFKRCYDSKAGGIGGEGGLRRPRSASEEKRMAERKLAKKQRRAKGHDEMAEACGI